MADDTTRMLKRFAPMVYGPTILFALGQGAVIPLIPIIAAQLGADIATSALIASALVIGQMCGNIPAGYLVARVGERYTMVGAGVLAMSGAAGIALAPSLGLLSASVFVVGLCAAAFGLARHSFMTTRVPVYFRARALSLLGGSFRFGMFGGPFVGALLLSLTGSEASASWFFGVCLLACVVLVAFGPDPEAQLRAEGALTRPVPTIASRAGDTFTDTGEPVTSGISLPGLAARAAQADSSGVAAGQRPPGVFRTMWMYREVLSRLGTAAATLSAVRAARQVVLPLWGVSIGLDAQTISLVVGVAGAIDFALFYVSGQIMDRFGRLWAVIPSVLLMGTGFIALSFTLDSAESTMWFAMFAVFIGVGNGLSSGVLLTLAADVAPKPDPAPFLGSWRTLTDAGGAVAPVMFSAITAVAGLSIATGAMGAIGLVGAIGFLRWVPRYVKPREKPQFE